MVGAVAAFVALAGAAWLGWERAEQHKERADIAEARVASLRASVRLLRAEMESDNAINNIPDSDLGRAADPRWLRGIGTD